MSKVSLILINIGSPDSFEKADAKSFIYNMLCDKHILNLPPLIRHLIAKIASIKGAKHFVENIKKVAINGRSPLRHYTTCLREKISDRMSMSVLTCYKYCGPKIGDAINFARRRGAEEFVFLPMYPQYSSASTLSAKEDVENAMSKIKLPWRFCEYYYDDEDYIETIYQSAKEQVAKSDALIVSFHSIPKNQEDKSPYVHQCVETAKLLAKKFPDKIVEIAWQSALKSGKWIGPTVKEKTIELIEKKSVKNLAVIAPGFAIDCTETLVELDIDLRDFFLKNGGKSFEYIKCLNDSPLQLQLIENLFYKYE